jgi:hypothetical protein
MGYEKHKRPAIFPAGGIALAALERGTNGQLLVGQTSAKPAYKTVSGDITIDETGLVAIIPSIIKTATINLSSVNLLGMNVTPVSIIAAPGSGKVLLVESILFEMIRSATAYASGGTIQFQYGTAGTVVHEGTIAASVLTTSGAATTLTHLRAATALTLAANESLVITNNTGAFTTGTGTAKVFVKYRVITY